MLTQAQTYHSLPSPTATVFVTGATGLVGSNLIKSLLRQKRNLRALYRREIPAMKNAENIEWIQGDILDPAVLEDAMTGVAEVYHCAGLVSFTPKNRALLYKTNVEGTANVVNACISKGVRKLVAISSVAALGREQRGRQVDETMNWSEETGGSEYGKSKYYSEMEVWRGIGEGLEAVIVNPSIILGAGNWDKGSTGIFRSVYQEFPWYTGGVNGFVDVNDLVTILQLLMESPVTSQRFIVSAENIAYRELFEMIADNFGKVKPGKKVTPLLAEIIWRIEKIKGFLTGKDPLLTRETSRTALASIYYDNSKLLSMLPEFRYTPIRESLKRICGELTGIYQSGSGSGK